MCTTNDKARDASAFETFESSSPKHGEHVISHKLLPHILDEDLLNAHLLSLRTSRLQLLSLQAIELI